MSTLRLEHANATHFIDTLEPASVQCVICDPPFGLGEDSFDKHYARDKAHIVEGYETAPQDNDAYANWCKEWIHKLPRILKADGTVYIVCAWNHLCDIELAIRSAPAPGLRTVNHIIWKYNFGVYTQKKFVTSHYHILRCAVGKATPKFNSRAFFSETEKTADAHNAQYTDMEDVWTIPKEYAQGETKNINKLPDALVRKMILYSTDKGDIVADFFMGNFTTAYVGRRLGRSVVGCELNKTAFDEHAPKVAAVEYGSEACEPKTSTKPANAGKRLTEDEVKKILARYDVLKATRTKKESMAMLETEFGRGHFSLVNILKKHGR